MKYLWSLPSRSPQSVEEAGCGIFKAWRERQRQKRGPGGSIKEGFMEGEAFELGLRERETLTKVKGRHFKSERLGHK